MEDKRVNRILYIYDRLIKGEIINKSQIIDKFDVNEKTVRRDMEDIRVFLENKLDSEERCTIEYNRKKKGYSLTKKDNAILNREDTLAIIKILLESRAFCKDELNHLITALLGQVNSMQRNCIKEIIGNELLNYVPLKHSKNLLNMLWDLSDLIRHKEVINIEYAKNDGTNVEREIKPVAIIFSEFYFYLIAYISGFEFNSPAVFRVDRIKSYKKKGEKFRILELDRFEDGEFRKRVQFMYPGKLMKIKFEFWGSSIDSILDRLPTAKVLNQYDNKYLIEAEVYGRGVLMWILSQGQYLKVIEPTEFKEHIKKTILEMKYMYE